MTSPTNEHPDEPAEAIQGDVTTVVAALQDQIDELRAAVTSQQRDINALRAELRRLQQEP